MAQGYIKLYRDILDNPVVCKDPEYFTVWCYLLLMATHSGRDVIFNGERIRLKAGQLTTGRKMIANKTKVSESKVQRILKTFEIEHQIEQVSDHKCRLVSIVNWDRYQKSEQVNEQQVNIYRTGSEQVLNTKQECKNEKKEKNDSYSLIRREEIRRRSEEVLKEMEQHDHN